MFYSFKKFGVNVMGYRVNKELEGKRIIISKVWWVFLLMLMFFIRDGRFKFKKIGKKKMNKVFCYFLIIIIIKKKKLLNSKRVFVYEKDIVNNSKKKEEEIMDFVMIVIIWIFKSWSLSWLNYD